MTWRIDDQQGDEAGKVKYLVVPFTRGAVLDMGCGPRKAFPHFIGVDSCKDTELFNIPIKPDVNCDVSDPKAVYETFEPGSCDAIFSSHCLEHIDDHEAALRTWWDIIKVGGHLVLYLPHRDLYPNIGEHGANPDHKHDFVAEDILLAMREIGHFDVLVNEVRSEEREYSFLLVLKKLDQPFDGLYSYVRNEQELQDRKTVCICRFGGFGDMIQTAGILPELKRQGFHITVMTTPKGQDILRDDPHIDDWLIQDNDQVPNHELGDYWRAWSRKFDRFVNLSESIEGTLLAIPGRANHTWPAAVRRKHMGINYHEFTAEIAGVDFVPDAKFYASMDEAAQAVRYLRHVSERVAKAPKPKARNAAQAIMGLPPTFMRDAVPLVTPVFNIMWCLSGSSPHKSYPHMDAVVAAILLEMPQAAIHFTGDEACQILEAGWENEARVFRQSGQMTIRQTLTLAQHCDLVMGPETGVLNSVAFDEKVAKIVMLSHSSHENLTKHWHNTIAIEPNREAAPCFPCHRLHYDRTYCPYDQDESNGRVATHAAMCAFSITPETVFGAVQLAYKQWKAAPYREAA